MDFEEKIKEFNLCNRHPDYEGFKLLKEILIILNDRLMNLEKLNILERFNMIYRAEAGVCERFDLVSKFIKTHLESEGAKIELLKDFDERLKKLEKKL